MNAVVPYLHKPGQPLLVVDLVADLSDPWCFLGKRRLDRALGALAGAGRPEVRWHGFRMVPQAASTAVPWREQLQSRLPKGVTAEFAERALAEAGREFGIEFDFSRLGRMPDTTEAHRLVWLAGREALAMETAEGIFRAFFERGADIGASGELLQIGAASGLSPGALEIFSGSQEGRAEVDQEESRLRGFGVAAVPNLLLNSHILVPGPVDVPVYVQAIDQALFPPLPEGAGAPTLH